MTNTEQIAAMAEQIEKLEGALERCLEVMVMQEQRQSEELHIQAFAFWPIWSGAKDDARALLSSGDQG